MIVVTENEKQLEEIEYNTNLWRHTYLVDDWANEEKVSDWTKKNGRMKRRTKIIDSFIYG